MKDYKKILEGVVNIINTTEKSDIGFANICTYIGENCPELKESDDEKTWIINYLSNCELNSSLIVERENLKKAITWLEKQGEQEIKEKPIWKHWKDGIAGNGEGKQIYLIKSGDSYTLSSCLGYECDYIELSELDRLLEKQGEQKPAWSEEDELMLSEAIEAVTESNYAEGRKEICIAWLKSIKERYTWKPSEEQMKILSIYADQNNSHGAVLTSLYQDLKKKG